MTGVRGENHAEHPPLFDRHAKTAFALALVVLVGGGLGFRRAVHELNVYLKKEPVELRWHFDNIATRFQDWEAVGESAKLSAEMVEELGTDLYLDRHYIVRDGDDKHWLSLHVAYYTGMIDAVPHVADRCLVAGGFNARSTPQNIPLELSRDDWRPDPENAAAGGSSPYQVVTYSDPITRQPVTVRMPWGDFALRTTEFSHEDHPDSRIYAGYFFIANNRVAVTPEDVKVFAFRKSEKFAYYCKVQLFTVGEKHLTAEDFADRAAGFIEQLLPELMRCLPDWSEVESRQGTLAGAQG